jgi:hypothetical protein
VGEAWKQQQQQENHQVHPTCLQDSGHNLLHQVCDFLYSRWSGLKLSAFLGTEKEMIWRAMLSIGQPHKWPITIHLYLAILSL